MIRNKLKPPSTSISLLKGLSYMISSMSGCSCIKIWTGKTLLYAIDETIIERECSEHINTGTNAMTEIWCDNRRYNMMDNDEDHQWYC